MRMASALVVVAPLKKIHIYIYILTHKRLNITEQQRFIN
jgi:hypothetical protein